MPSAYEENIVCHSNVMKKFDTCSSSHSLVLNFIFQLYTREYCYELRVVQYISLIYLPVPIMLILIFEC